MKVAFNGTSMLRSLTGIGRYAREIALGLQRAPNVQADILYGVRWRRDVPSAAMPGANRLFPLLRDKLPGAYAPRRWAQTATLSCKSAKRGFDLYHEPAILALPYRGLTVLTVHDLSWIRFPETQPVARVRMLNRYFEQGLRRSAMILAPSEFVKQELVQHFQLPADQVRVTPLAADSDYRPMTSLQTSTVLTRFGLKHGHYLLAVGTLEPRKNLGTALDAFEQLPVAIRNSYPLVVVGMSGWNAGPLMQRLEPLVRNGNVRQLGYLSHDDLVKVTAGATTLVFPSIYEGFGLPPLEAMCCAVPPIVSNVASLPEVLGGAGLEVAPYDSSAMVDAMRRLIEDSAERRRLGALGVKRAIEFSWERCVRQTLDAYSAALLLRS